jgi:hypothetical protein
VPAETNRKAFPVSVTESHLSKLSNKERRKERKEKRSEEERRDAEAVRLSPGEKVREREINKEIKRE